MAGEYLTTSHFEVSIEGMKAKQFTEVDGLGIDIEALNYQEGSMSVGKTVKGRTSVKDIVLKRRFDGDKELMTWLNSCSKEKVTKRSGSIILKDEGGKEVLRFNFTGAWPKGWRGPQFSTMKENKVSLEETILDVETLEMA